MRRILAVTALALGAAAFAGTKGSGRLATQARELRGFTSVELRGPLDATVREGREFQVKVTVDDEIPDVRPGFTCTAEITTATRQKAIAIPIQATTVREMIVDHEGNIVRDETKGPQRGGRGSVQAAELKPGQERKELEGVFVVRDNKALFSPVKTGIAGEKYFEVLSGANIGDQVIVGPFSSVRELKDGQAVKTEVAPRSTTTATK